MSALDKALAPFARVGLAHLPTPLEPMMRLTERLSGPRLWVKREDCTGLGLAGLIALIRSGRWTSDQDVVFINTGGALSLFAYRHLFS